MQVWDWDKTSKDDLLGTAVFNIPAEGIKTNDRGAVLHKRQLKMDIIISGKYQKTGTLIILRTCRSLRS